MNVLYPPAPHKTLKRLACFAAGCFLAGSVLTGSVTASDGPYSKQGNDFGSMLLAPDPAARARAAVGLGYLRFHPAEDKLIEAMADAWQQWVAALPAQGLPADLLAMLASEDHHQVERGGRPRGR